MEAWQGRWPRWRQALALGGVRGALCFGPNRGRKVTYTNPRRWLPGFEPADGPAALAEVVRRYLHAYGPATPQQLAQWLAWPRRFAGELFDRVAGGLEQVEVAGVWHQRRSGRDLDVTVEPFGPLGATRRRQLDDQVRRLGEILEGSSRLTIGAVTTGGHA